MELLDKLDKLLNKNARDFFDGIEVQSYQYREDRISKKVDEYKKDVFWNYTIGAHAEMIGCALVAEMDKTGKPLSEEMFNGVMKKFKLYNRVYDRIYAYGKHSYLDMPDIYKNPENLTKAKEYLINTWKHGEELGQALGYSKKDIELLRDSFNKSVFKEEDNAKKSNTSSGFVQNATRSDVKSY